MIKISIIIPCYNNLSFLIKLFESLIHQTFTDFEVIVFNNGSNDGLNEWLEKNIFSFKLIVIQELQNIGYAKAVNKSLTHASSDLIIVLNADLTLDKFFLEAIFLEFNNSNCELASVVIKNYDGSKIDSVGLYLTNFLRALNTTQESKILGPTGAAFAFKKQILNKIKIKFGTVYDERYFFLWEDVELALRAKTNNIKTKIISNAICYHYGNATKSNYFYKQFLSLRNRYYLIKDYFPNYITEYWHVILLYDIPRLIFFILFNKYRFKVLS